MASPSGSGPATDVDLLGGILGFARLLRGCGLPVSPAEVIDAARAVAAVPEVCEERDAFEAPILRLKARFPY